MSTLRFDIPRRLLGDLLDLRPLKDSDFEELYQAASDPLIWEQHPVSTRHERDAFKSYFESAMMSRGALAVRLRATGEIIGSSRYYEFKREPPAQVVVGYTFLARDYWGGIHNKELKRLMLDHAFQTVQNVVFQIGETNTRSRRAIEKIGAQLIESTILDETPYVIYRIQKSEWAALRLKLMPEPSSLPE